MGLEPTEIDKKKKKVLYDYQQRDIDKIFYRLKEFPGKYNLLYQLPTGGGKTVIFSEIVRRYIESSKKKVVVLTHRIELCGQTSKMLTEFRVKNKIINSSVKGLDDQDEYMCFVAMVETLNNRLNEDHLELHNVGMVIIDEAHYNSFRKLFKFFDNCFILGVTATPLSSNMKLPMKDNYNELIVGDTINSLIKSGFLAKPVIYTYDVGLGSLKIGMNGDYTVKSSEDLYTNMMMQDKLLHAYEERSKNKKTLIFNNGINTSIYVYDTFKKAGYPIRHLDNTNSKQEREDILAWFKNTSNAILTSVSILTTGFDEPTVETVILNRATKSLTLYFQMIGRGSRILPTKSEFSILDLGNNTARFGLWNSDVDWQSIFRSPDFYYDNLVGDEEIERNFKYVLPEDLRKEFSNSDDIEFDIEDEYSKTKKYGLRSLTVLENSIEQHAKMCVQNSEDVFDARILSKLLDQDIEYRVRRYSYCISKSTKNYRDWLEEDYKRKLRSKINQLFMDS
ncbi:DEAD/DEAH box helicase [Aquimarina sediminis]|uniref:DEAD/DEAH box helicase n=1 Tax=Aquimarina sediminis TaxID=2070536 RepID=UPI000CA08A89|nr:DEAD/DEAH box helicase [Aquimarina sediminis]